jgi:hypothetical protein
VLLPDDEGYAARAVIQWITTGPPGASVVDSVHAQTELPTGKAIFPLGATLTAMVMDSLWTSIPR